MLRTMLHDKSSPLLPFFLSRISHECVDRPHLSCPACEHGKRECKHLELDQHGLCLNCRVYNIYDDPNSLEYQLLQRWQARRSA
jgi:hypothetical protein